MVARITLKGYAAKELLLSDGPVNWMGLNGRNHGEYRLFKTVHFQVNLDLIPEVFTGTISARGARNRDSRVSLGRPLGISAPAPN